MSTAELFIHLFGASLALGVVLLAVWLVVNTVRWARRLDRRD